VISVASDVHRLVRKFLLVFKYSDDDLVCTAVVNASFSCPFSIFLTCIVPSTCPLLDIMCQYRMLVQYSAFVIKVSA